MQNNMRIYDKNWGSNWCLRSFLFSIGFNEGSIRNNVRKTRISDPLISKVFFFGIGF